MPRSAALTAATAETMASKLLTQYDRLTLAVEVGTRDGIAPEAAALGPGFGERLARYEALVGEAVQAVRALRSGVDGCTRDDAVTGLHALFVPATDAILHRYLHPATVSEVTVEFREMAARANLDAVDVFAIKGGPHSPVRGWDQVVALSDRRTRQVQDFQDARRLRAAAAPYSRRTALRTAAGVAAGRPR